MRRAIYRDASPELIAKVNFANDNERPLDVVSTNHMFSMPELRVINIFFIFLKPTPSKVQDAQGVDSERRCRWNWSGGEVQVVGPQFEDWQVCHCRGLRGSATFFPFGLPELDPQMSLDLWAPCLFGNQFETTVDRGHCPMASNRPVSN